MSIDPRFIVNLRGRDYPTWPGVLDAATRAGLRSLRTTLLQTPTTENGHMAIVQAHAIFEDGREFEDLGDASPANCSAMIATAAIRMASTRAKGRCLRDAINVGQTMFEELPDWERREETGNGQHAVPVQPGVAGSVGDGVRPGASAGGPGRAPARAPAAPAAGAATAPARCQARGCDRFVTPKQRDDTLSAYGEILCPLHARQMAEAAGQQ